MERVFKFSTSSTNVEFLAKSTYRSDKNLFKVYRNDNTSDLEELIVNRKKDEKINVEIYEKSDLKHEAICELGYGTGQDFFFVYLK